MSNHRLEFLTPIFSNNAEVLAKENEDLRAQLKSTEEELSHNMWWEFALGVLVGSIIGAVIVLAVVFGVKPV